MSFDLSQLSDEQLEQLESELSQEDQGLNLQNLSDEQLQQLEQSLSGQQQAQQPEQQFLPDNLQDFLTRRSVALSATTESIPRTVLETPESAAELLNIVSGQRALQREAEEEGMPQPINLIDSILSSIPEQARNAFQSFKEIFPTFQESKERIIQQYPQEMQEALTQQSGVEDYLDAGQNFLANSAVLGVRDPRALIGSVTAGFSSEAARKNNFSPEGEVFATILGGGVPEAGASIIENAQRVAQTPQELAFKTLRPRLKNIDPEIVKIAREENINPSIATVTKGGISQMGQNVMSQNFLTKNAFDQFAANMGQDIINAAERKVQNLSADEFVNLNRATKEQLGEVPFNNPAKIVADSLSEPVPPKANTGEAIQQRFELIADQQKQQASELFNNLKTDDAVQTQDFNAKGAAAQTARIKSQKGKAGLQSPETKALVEELNNLENFFVETSEREVNGKTIQRKTPRQLSVSDAIAQVEELNRIIDFNESIGNQSKALVPIRSSLIEDINQQLSNIGREDLAQTWQQAKEQYRDYASTFGRDNRAVFDSMRTQKPETIIGKANSQSGMKNLLKAFSKSGENEPLYGELQRQVVESIYGDNLIQAENLENFKLNDSKISQLKELKPIMPFDAQLLFDEAIDTSRRVKKGMGNKAQIDAIRADVANASQKGELPTQTLKQMRTPQGLQNVREALRGTELGNEYLGSLEKQTARGLIFDNALDPITNEPNLTQLRKNIRNPNVRRQLKSILGEETFGQLDNIGKFTDKAIEGDRAFRNFSQTATTQQNVSLFHNLLTGMGLLTAGKIFAFTKSMGTIGGIWGFSKLYTNPRFINRMLDTVKIGAEAKPTPQNARLYFNAVTDTVKMAQEILGEEDQQNVLQEEQESVSI